MARGDYTPGEALQNEEAVRELTDAVLELIRARRVGPFVVSLTCARLLGITAARLDVMPDQAVPLQHRLDAMCDAVRSEHGRELQRLATRASATCGAALNTTEGGTRFCTLSPGHLGSCRS